MVVHKLTPPLFFLILVSLVVDFSIVLANPAQSPQLHRLTDSQRAFLSRIARRTLRDVALGRGDYEPGYTPASLSDLHGEAIVRLRLDGYLLAQTSVGPGPLDLVIRDAALASTRSFIVGNKLDLDIANRVLIEIELIGPTEPLPKIADWTQPQALDGHLEPGVHGLMLNGAGLNYRFCPTEVITSDRQLSEALGALAQASLPRGEDMAKVRLARFRTVHWYQRKTGAQPVSLHRGLTLVSSDQVTRGGLQNAISILADYMIDRQLDSGLFTYQYEPGQDVFAEDNSPVRQIGAAVALAVHAQGGKDASKAAARRAIQFHLHGVTPLSQVENASFVATADGKNSLGVTALLCLLLGEFPDAQPYADIRQQLIEGMLWLQRPSGMFLTAFPPARAVEGQDHFPGQALLAMAVHYAKKPSGRVLDAFDQALKHYRAYFSENPNPIFAPWQARAFSAMAMHTKREDFSNFVFELADWIVGRQLNEANCDWPELYGGIALHHSGFANFTTGIQLEALSDALTLARRRGDVQRVEVYEKAVRAAARFVMQLQIRPEEAYYMRSPRDAIGGIRTHLALNLLRIDHSHHALIGLIKARDVLYPRED